MGIFDKFKRKKKDKTPEKKAVAKDVPENKEEAKAQEIKTQAQEVKSTVKVALISTIAHKVLLAPILSEKTFKMQSEHKYVFKIKPEVNKHQVKSAIKELYGVKPLKVNIVRKQSVIKYRWGRRVGKTNREKRAIVTMPEGTILNLTE